MADTQIIKNMSSANYEAALKEIVREYGERLYWHIRLMVNSHEDADDLLQNVYVKVWQAMPKFRKESGLFTWLYRIATNECLNHLKRRNLVARFNPSVAVEELSKIEADPHFNGNELQKELFKAMSQLPPKQRLVFEMRYFQELEYEDISKITGTSTGALKASYHFAYQKIKTSLEKLF